MFLIVTKMQVWLPASTKAKFMRQMLVQKARGLFKSHNLGKIVDSPLKDHSLFLLKSSSYKGQREDVFFFFLSNYLASFWHAQDLYPFIFLAFGTLSLRIFPCVILANGNTLQHSMTVYSTRISEKGRDCFRKPGDAPALSLPPHTEHSSCTSRSQLESKGHPWIPVLYILCAAPCVSPLQSGHPGLCSRCHQLPRL